jgi:uncharacterized protein (DUF2235 family)
MQRLAIYLDGTWNDPADKTNVHRLSELTAAIGLDGVPQHHKYIPGVGNEFGKKLRGGALGAGLSDKVREAYDWLRSKYDWSDPEHPEQHNEIFIFGFSRGAYTARSLGGLIANCGLPRDGTLTTDELYERYKERKDRKPSIWQLAYILQTNQRPLTAEEQRLLAHSQRVPIQMLGVWDTVGALGIPWTVPIWRRSQYHFHNPNLSKIYRHAFHALAIDEHRHSFKPTLWTLFSPEGASQEPMMPPPQACEQRWFVGAHSDVGGGGTNPLTFGPGRWLQDKAQSLDLNFTAPVALKPGAAQNKKPEDSYAKFMWGIYRVFTLGKRLHRPIGVVRNSVKGGWSYPVNETIDASVFDYCRANADYQPKNLVEWQQKMGVQQLVQLSGMQLARLPK